MPPGYKDSLQAELSIIPPPIHSRRDNEVFSVSSEELSNFFPSLHLLHSKNVKEPEMTMTTSHGMGLRGAQKQGSPSGGSGEEAECLGLTLHSPLKSTEARFKKHLQYSLVLSWKESPLPIPISIPFFHSLLFHLCLPLRFSPFLFPISPSRV